MQIGIVTMPQIMERNEKQWISVKSINIFNIIYYTINALNIRTFLSSQLAFLNMKELVL